MRRIILFSFILTLLIIPNESFAKDGRLKALRAYATILGQANACKMYTAREYIAVEKWMKNEFDDSQQDAAFDEFANRHSNAFNWQIRGDSPDTCIDVQRSFDAIDWPELP